MMYRCIFCGRTYEELPELRRCEYCGGDIFEKIRHPGLERKVSTD
jgi:DNA-directed RNA polymerase subunit RPC12/RpoP